VSYLTLSDVENDIITCQYHLNLTNTKGTSIESFLIRFLLVRICGQYEKEIERIMNERAQKYGDLEIARFIGGTFESYKHLKLDAIRGKILKKFGGEILTIFNHKVKGKNFEIRFNNIITNRDSSAHGGLVNITFDELVISYNESKKVLVALEETLS